MVRIRSDRWYSGENQKKIRGAAPSNSFGVRRTASLIFMLLLVIILMMKVSNPKNVSNMFDALGIPLERTVIDSTAVETPGSSIQADSTVEPDWQKTCLDLIPRILRDATNEQIDQLAIVVFSTDTAKTRAANPSAKIEHDVEMTLNKLRETLDSSSAEGANWSKLLDRFAEQWKKLASLVSSPPDRLPSDKTELDVFFRKHLQEYLDQRLIKNLRDASPWSGDEAVAFGRLLQRSSSAAPESKKIPYVSTKQLDTEFPKWRSNWIRFRGTVRLVESVSKQQPLFDQASYRVMWLRGEDLSSQPVAVYTVQPLADKLAEELIQNRLPEIEVTALVGKKLAYASASGVQVAPTLFTGSFVQFAYRENQMSGASGNSKWDSKQIAIVALAAVVLGLIVSTTLWKQMSRSKKNRSTGAASMLVGVVLSCVFAADGRAQPPPWAEKSSQYEQKRQYVQQQLSSQVTPNSLQQLEGTLAGNSTGAPELVLRTLLIVKQVGWNTVWDSERPLSLTSETKLLPTKIQGVVRGLQPLPLSEHQQQWFSLQPFKQIYKLLLQLDAEQTVSDSTAKDADPTPSLKVVFCADVPSMWVQSAQLRQPIQIHAFGLAQQAESPSDKEDDLIQCYITESVSWKVDGLTPQQLDQLQPALPTTWRELGSIGWDLAWFDLLAKNNKRPLLKDESQPFRSMLELTSKESAKELVGQVSPIDAIRDTSSNIGRSLDWQVRLVNATLVELSSELSYYQFDGFVHLPNDQTIKFDSGRDDGQTVDFKDEFPVTLLSLGAHGFIEKAETSAPGTWKVGRTAQVHGRLYRLWSYESQRLKSPTGNGRLLAPLVMASSITPVQIKPQRNTSSGWLLYLLAMAIVIAVSSFVQLRFLKRPARRKPS